MRRQLGLDSFGTSIQVLEVKGSCRARNSEAYDDIAAAAADWRYNLLD